MQNSFETNRLRLTFLTAEDDAFIFTLLNSKGWLDFIGDRNIHTKEAALAYINKILNTDNFYYWVVRLKDGNIPIGIISFLKRDYLENFDIGFAFLSEYSGKGYALEGAKVVLDKVSAEGNYFPVLATTMLNNVRSIKLLIKLGLRFEQQLEVGGEQIQVYTNAP